MRTVAATAAVVAPATFTPVVPTSATAAITVAFSASSPASTAVTVVSASAAPTLLRQLGGDQLGGFVRNELEGRGLLALASGRSDVGEVDAIETEVGLGLELVAHLGPLGQQRPGALALGLLGPDDTPGEAVVAGKAGDFDLEAA